MFFRQKFEQNNASKQKVGHCDKLRCRFFIFIILNIYISLIFHAKIQPKISCGSGAEVYFVVFAFLVTVAILDPIL